MSEPVSTRLRGEHMLSVRIDAALFNAIVRDAAELGVSIAAASRLRLRTGRVPKLEISSTEKVSP